MSRVGLASRRAAFVLSLTAALVSVLALGAGVGLASSGQSRATISHSGPIPLVECGPGCLGGGGCSTATRVDREACGYNFFRSEGLTRAQAAGLVGNLSVESAGVCSGMDPSCWEGGCSDHSFYDSVCGFGIAQWTYYTRKEGLLNFAGSVSAAEQLVPQIWYVWQELTTTYSSALNHLKAVSGNTQSSVNQASDVVMYDYENPGVLNQSARRSRSWTVFQNNPY